MPPAPINFMKRCLPPTLSRLQCAVIVSDLKAIDTRLRMPEAHEAPPFSVALGNTIKLEGSCDYLAVRTVRNIDA
jgi:hypothetical protein